MTRQKLLHRMKEVCGATRHMMKDGLIVEEHQLDGTRLFKKFGFCESEVIPHVNLKRK